MADNPYVKASVKAAMGAQDALEAFREAIGDPEADLEALLVGVLTWRELEVQRMIADADQAGDAARLAEVERYWSPGALVRLAATLYADQINQSVEHETGRQPTPDERSRGVASLGLADLLDSDLVRYHGLGLPQ